MEDKRTEQYRQELKEFVMSHTEDVLKNPRSFIRYPFIDPGSVYDGNVWDWDTYWSVSVSYTHLTLPTNASV